MAGIVELWASFVAAVLNMVAVIRDSCLRCVRDGSPR